MNVLNAIKKRRSIRKFKPDAVSDEQIKTLIESARLAPSGTNSQPWRFVVIKDGETKKELQQAAHNQKHVGLAPVVIACCADINVFYEFPKRIDELVDSGALPTKSRSFFVPSIKKDLESTPKSNLHIAAAGNTAIAITNIMLQAAEMGLGSCWVRWYNDDKVKEILNIPQHVDIVALLPIGIPDEEPDPRPRLSLENITFYEKYGNRTESRI